MNLIPRKIVSARPGGKGRFRMNSFLAIVGLLSLLVVYLLCAHLYVRNRIERRLAEEFGNLQKGTLLSIRTPAFLDTGPFPKVEHESGTVIVQRVGEVYYYREVRWQDKENNQRVSWARVTVWLVFAQIRHVDWKHETESAS
jgi:hypothetical protein